MNPPTPSFYQLAWRWHFYAGLFVIPFLIMLALTGLIYLFKPQLDQAMYADLLRVAPAEQRLDADQQLARVQAAYPQARVLKYQPPATAEASAQFVIADAGRELNLFVDPYRGSVLGSQDAHANLQAIARSLHGTGDCDPILQVAGAMFAVDHDRVPAVMDHDLGDIRVAEFRPCGRYKFASSDAGLQPVHCATPMR